MTSLFRSVYFEKMSSLFQGEEVAVDVYLIFACVVRNGDDVAHTMAAVAKNLNDKIDIYHAAEFTGLLQRRHLARYAA